MAPPMHLGQVGGRGDHSACTHSSRVTGRR